MSAPSIPSLKFVVSIEDKQPMIWQLAVFLESLHGKLPPAWETIVVVCNDSTELSTPLSQILSDHQVRHFCTVNHAQQQNIDFIGRGREYFPLNKITALEVVAAHVKASDMVCLCDVDVFLYGDLNTEAFPARDALCDNWLINKPLFFSNRRRAEGVDLHKLLEAIGSRRKFQGGGVVIFLRGETVQNRAFVRDCFRFAQVLFLLGRIKNVRAQWIAEMPAYALSLTAHDIDYDVHQRPEFSVEQQSDRVISQGSLYHYFADGAFWGSSWAKGHFRCRDLLEADLDRFRRLAQSDHEKYFFALAEKAGKRLDGDLRTSHHAGGRPPIRRRVSRWFEERIMDRLRYLRYHALKAMDPQAAGRRALQLPTAVSLLYRALSPIRLRRR